MADDVECPHCYAGNVARIVFIGLMAEAFGERMEVEVEVGAGADAMRWSKTARHAFLDHLSMTGDVAASAAAAGMSVTAAYAKRRREPRFAREWRDAAAAAWERLEDSPCSACSATASIFLLAASDAKFMID